MGGAGQQVAGEGHALRTLNGAANQGEVLAADVECKVADEDGVFKLEASFGRGLGGKENKLVQLLRSEHPYASIAVFTDDIHSDKLRHVLPAARRGDGDASEDEGNEGERARRAQRPTQEGARKAGGEDLPSRRLVRRSGERVASASTRARGGLSTRTGGRTSFC